MRLSLCFCISCIGTATTEIYTLSLHDALPISSAATISAMVLVVLRVWCPSATVQCGPCRRSEEHTSELQSLTNLVCRLLLEKKKKQHIYQHYRPQRPAHAER